MRHANHSKAKYISAATTALRPSLPAFCRKRSLCQGQALRVAYASLDIRARDCGIKYMRATDGDASGGGSVNGYIHSKCEKAKGKIHIRHSGVHCPEIQFAKFPDTMRVIAAYRQNAMLMNIGNLPDADFSHTNFRKYAFPFVRRYFRRPAYVSSIRCAYSLTAGEGQSPFEPQKAKRQERQ